MSYFEQGARVEAEAGDPGRAIVGAGLPQGRMISGCKDCPKGHTCFFNACIFVLHTPSIFKARREWKQVWWGDLDLTADRDKLLRAAMTAGTDLVVTRERYRWNGYRGEEGDGVVVYHHA